ncbi:MAG: hypothetical protein KDD67_12135 [Ignavibacteriae bacterium]|nr:hypothetical protein [Ignavibacteriota bacterium]MCB9217237.1 hypothetical protein [Ignavibacteria bacterium]
MVEFLHKELGIVSAVYEKNEQLFYLTAKLFVPDSSKPMLLYFDSKDARISQGQEKLYISIQKNYSDVIRAGFAHVADFMNGSEYRVNGSTIEDYEVESIRIPTIEDDEDFLEVVWSLDFVYLKNGFSYLIVEYKNLLPFNVYPEH